MARRVTSSIVVLVLLAAVPAAGAQRSPGKNDNARFGDPSSTARMYQDFLYGVVKKIDKAEMVLGKTKFGVDQTIKLEAKTKYVRDGKASTFADLKVGDEVYVQTKKERKTGDLVAKKVVTGLAATEE